MLEMGLDARERLRDLARLLIKEEKVILTSRRFPWLWERAHDIDVLPTAFECDWKEVYWEKLEINYPQVHGKLQINIKTIMFDVIIIKKLKFHRKEI